MPPSPARGHVLITGASTGIGEACALRLARDGFHVFAGVRRDADGQRLLGQCATDHLTPVIIDVIDLTTIAAVRDTIGAAVADRGLAGVVNNAGISVAGPLEVLPLERFKQQMDVNVNGQVAVTQAFLPLVRQARGRIVFMGSIGGRMASPFLAPYNASKFALEAITDALRLELAPWRIHVSIVEPGSIATPIWDKSLALSDQIEREIPPEGAALYQKQITAMRKAAAEIGAGGIPADEVAKAVEQALTAKKPKTRYVVGRDARIQAFAVKFVPDRMRDGIIARRLRLPKKP
jgi:NAD(P)-dependent dehydrogenase (short-subunit alcohol dehydrogenase family)